MKVTIDEKANELVIRAPLNTPPEPSKSGKTLVVSTSHGNKPTTAQINGQPVTVGFSAYIPRDDS